jgi:hypothetical protein
VLVGRDRELERLARAVDCGGSVTILGEAGIGKTAVLREAASRNGRRVYEGGGIGSLSWHSYLPFTRALGRRLAGANASDVAAKVVEQGMTAFSFLTTSIGRTPRRSPSFRS